MLGRRTQRARTPTRLQMEATECGAACLAIVLEYFGSYVPLAKLRQECGVSRDGSKASNVISAARAYGCDARGFRKEPHELAALRMPVILHWNFNHFVVLEGFGRERAYLNDPSCGPYSVSITELEQAFTGVVLVIQPTAAFISEGRRPRILPNVLGRLSGAKSTIALVVLAGLALALPGVLIPTFAKIFVDDVLLFGKHDWLRGLWIGMALTAAVRAALTLLERAYLARLVIRLGVSMSSRFLWHALRLPVGFFHARSPGDLAGRVQLNDAAAGALSSQLSRGLLDLLLASFYALMMLYYNARLALIGFITAALHVVLLKWSERLRIDLGRRVENEDGKLAGVASSGLQMIETLKAAGSEGSFFSQWAGHQAKLIDAQQTLQRRDQWVRAVVGLLSRVNALLVLAVGAKLVMDGYLSIGGLVAFESLMASFIVPIEGMSQLAATFQELQGKLERLDDVQRHELAASSNEPTEHSTVRPLTGELVLEGLTFGYSPRDPALVENLNLRIAPGQRVALVGGTGSGKSTVAKLVTGLYAPWSGRILFDGRPREQIPGALLTACIAFVDQDVSLFEGTVRENLTLWNDTIPETDLVQAAKDACIHDDISRLPGGYDARITEGGYNLSGGQRQRLEIARALVRQPALLVLDEATSALDPEVERQVDDNLRRRGCACLIVAHRLSTIRDCDEIIVLDRGRVVQRGSHQQLMASLGSYRSLIEAA